MLWIVICWMAMAITMLLFGTWMSPRQHMQVALQQHIMDTL